MNELKPCPFCGFKPHLVHGIDGQVTAIWCPNCHAITKFRVPEMKRNETFGENADKWIEQWNRRDHD